MNEVVHVAGVQMDATLGNKPRNLDAIETRLEEAVRNGAQLAVFPECAVTGYCFNNAGEARAQAESVPGPATERLTAVCHRLGCHLVAGLLEADGDRLFNACVLVGPTGVLAVYRKIHLPRLGVDCFTTPGNRPFAVADAGGLRIGMHICYDGAFPESARVMALAGAELLVLPTNWPPGTECTAAYVTNARALENNVYYLAVNRVGTERGFRFIGRSKLCDTDGSVLAEAAHSEEAIIYGTIEPAKARRKRLVRVPGRHEIHRFADRRPEMYGPLTDPSLRPPREEHGS